MRAVLLGFAAALCSCQAPPPEPAERQDRDQSSLPALAEPLPDAPGKDTVSAVCLGCHSGRYLTSQPRFPETTWRGIVGKMQTAYGVVLTPEQVDAIVGYLGALGEP